MLRDGEKALNFSAKVCRAARTWSASEGKLGCGPAWKPPVLLPPVELPLAGVPPVLLPPVLLPPVLLPPVLVEPPDVEPPHDRAGRRAP